MPKKPRLPKPPSPENLNGDHDRGFEVYKLLWTLNSRISRIEILYAFLQAAVVVLLVREFGAF